MSILDANTLAAGFADADIAVKLHVFGRLPSTQTYLKNHANNLATHGIPSAYNAELCICDWQTDGNGRRGRSWSSKPGNITFSLLTQSGRDQSELMGLSLVTGICLSETIRELTGFPTSAKWPNDVILQDEKLAGILVDICPQREGEHLNIITGIGLNYLEDSDTDHLEGLGVTSLAAHGEVLPSRIEIIVAAVKSIIDGYSLFEEQGWPPFVKRWDALDYLKDKDIEVQLAKGEPLYGQAAGVAPDGALLVTRDGQTSSFHNAEVSVRLSSNIT
ncbi:MAG: biotin--[acetyl-CoA-carboxylase] ligase [Gammaproteobacteria bacterium]|nr:biotin--[acetyl-CoA-carboxylase] ligase [Gammaproteobacteria bacterium]